MSTKKTAEKDEKLDFEAIYTELESLISQLENNESVSLEASLKAFESGINLTRKAQAALSKAEQKVQLLLEKNGEVVTQPMAGDEEPR
jgi:exodeoxyribonuclease VII small subunit